MFPTVKGIDKDKAVKIASENKSVSTMEVKEVTIGLKHAGLVTLDEVNAIIKETKEAFSNNVAEAEKFSEETDYEDDYDRYRNKVLEKVRDIEEMEKKCKDYVTTNFVINLPNDDELTDEEFSKQFDIPFENDSNGKGNSISMYVGLLVGFICVTSGLVLLGLDFLSSLNTGAVVAIACGISMILFGGIYYGTQRNKRGLVRCCSLLIGITFYGGLVAVFNNIFTVIFRRSSYFVTFLITTCILFIFSVSYYVFKLKQEERSE